MIEVLVVLGIVSLLAVLSLAAVQQVRANARRLECLDRERQIAVALHSFEASQGYLPLRSNEFPFDIGQQLELGDLKSILGRSRILTPLICPADSLATLDQGQQNYSQNGGSGFLETEPYTGVIPAWIGPPRRTKDITDGLSQTALLSERLTYGNSTTDFSEAELKRDPLRFPWSTESHFPDLDQATAECQQGLLTPWPWRGEYNTYIGGDGYSHRLPPNNRPCANNSRYYRPNISFYRPLLTATSQHAGGVNLVFVDGSGRFISQAIDLPTWQALGTIQGAEQLSSIY